MSATARQTFLNRFEHTLTIASARHRFTLSRPSRHPIVYSGMLHSIPRAVHFVGRWPNFGMKVLLDSSTHRLTTPVTSFRIEVTSNLGDLAECWPTTAEHGDAPCYPVQYSDHLNNWC